MEISKNSLVCITQPEHLPWLGYIDKMVQSDYLIFLDNVQFKKRHFENRNKIRANNKEGYLWLTVPVITKGKYTQKINEVEIDYSSNWVEKYIKSIEHNYKKAPYFTHYIEEFKVIIESKPKLLVDLNISIIKFVARILNIKVEFLRASELCNEGKSSELILNLLKSVNASRYFSGKFGGLDDHLLLEHNITTKFQEFEHPSYEQVYPEFVTGMSFLDLLFNHGENSLDKIYK